MEAIEARDRSTESSSQVLTIGCGAGFSGDRVDATGPVVDMLIAEGGPAVLIFETLAERTLALAQLAMRQDASVGYEPLLDDLLTPVLARCMDHGIKIVSNFGAANPLGAAKRILAIASELGIRKPRIAVVVGDDLLVDESEVWQARLPDVSIVSVNAYIGAASIAQALREGADIVVCGRVADPSLVLGPALAHYNWALDDWDALAGATMAGHLLECGAQVCGGYYADPGFKDIAGLANIGFPVAQIHADGSCVVGKPIGTGGLIDEHTVKEQLLYEIHDPHAYVTPDVIADISSASVTQLAPNSVRLSHVLGHARPAELKVNVCYENGWLAEGEISYSGARAEARARLAGEILKERLAGLGALRVDLIGVMSVFADDSGIALADQESGHARDVRLRVALSHEHKSAAQRVTNEVTALYTCGPAGGGGVRTSLRPRLGLDSCTVPRERVKVRHIFIEE